MIPQQTSSSPSEDTREYYAERGTADTRPELPDPLSLEHELPFLDTLPDEDETDTLSES